MTLSLNLDSGLNEILEKWEDTLTSNHDDFVSVDGEEGDFGVVRYHGFDVNGNADVHLMTTYIEGGDSESSYYTPAGAAVVEKLARANIEILLQKALADNMDPGEVGGLYHGFVGDVARAEAHVEKHKLKFRGQLHRGYSELFPDVVENNDVFRVDYKFFQARVYPNGMMYFFNILNFSERLCIEIKQSDKPTRGLFYTGYESWKAGFGKYRSVIVAVRPETSFHETPTGPIEL